MSTFDEALSAYVAGCQRISDEYMEQRFPTLDRPTIEATDGGKKRVRIVRSTRSGRSVHSFVDIATGDVLKAASWAAPAKNARGNIYDEHNGLGYMTEYGPLYMREIPK